jgi:hypothetical protein
MFWDSIFPGLNAVMKAMWQLFLVIFILPTQLLIRVFHAEKVFDPNRGKKNPHHQWERTNDKPDVGKWY